MAILLLVILAGTACGDSQGSGISADEVVRNALAAQARVSSSHIEATVQASATGTLQGAALNVNLSGQDSGDVDWANRKAKSLSQLSGSYNGLPVSVTAQTYAVDNYTYSQVTAFGTAENWTRSPLAATHWATQSYVQLIYGLLEYAEPDLQADEPLNGVDCYVLKLEPDYEAIKADLGQQYPQIAAVPDLGQLFDHLSILVWVARDTSFVTRIEIVAAAHAAPEDLGETANGETVTVSLTLTVEASRINEPVAISLPPEALNAAAA